MELAEGGQDGLTVHLLLHSRWGVPFRRMVR